MIKHTRFIALLVLPFFILSTPGYSAPLAVPAVSAPALSSQIGIIAAVQGSVKIENKTQAGRIAQSGEPVYIGDTVSTDSQGTLQILLMDETIFTIGPNSAIVIDKFIYDPASESGQINAKVVKGVFRFVTGKIARKKPSDMKVDLPSGSIGVRGTIVAGQTDGKRSTVVLLGPGSKTNTNHRIGQITVGNDVNGKYKEVRVTRPGFGSVIDGAGAEPTAPFKVPQAEIDSIMAALDPEPAASPDESAGPDKGVDPTHESGQDRASAKEPVQSLSRSEESLKDLERESESVSQDLAADGGTVMDGVSKFEQLARITSGKFKYVGDNIPLTTNGNTFDFTFEIDFGNRTIGGDVSKNNIEASTSGGNAIYEISQKGFGEMGNAVFQYDNVTKSSGSCTGCGTANYTVGINNSGGVIAENARVSLFLNGNGEQGSGQSDFRQEI